MSKYLVAIDCGHGMKTSGKETVPMDKDLYIDGKLVRKRGKRIKENEWNRGVGEYLAKALKRCGIEYYFTADMTGETDTPLSTRANRANTKDCDILVSCHYNAIGSCSSWQNKANGLLVIKTKGCQSKSVTLSNKIYNELKNDIKYDGNGATRYGVMTDVNISGFTLAILRQTKMPACLIEYGFMDYKNEAYKMLDENYQKKCAEATCKGICKYFGMTYKKETTKPTKQFQVKVLSNTLNVRKIADWNADPITKVKKGQHLDVIATVDAKNGKTKMYKLESGLYITAHSNYVEIVK